LLATDQGAPVNRHPHMGLEFPTVRMMAGAIVEYCIYARMAQHSLRDEALFDADGAPGHASASGFDRPDYIRDGWRAATAKFDGSESYRVPERQQSYSRGGNPEQCRRPQ
jgi:hypothetical protein